jgi:hypothetical protein
VKVFQKIDRYRAEGPLGGWIARTMVNTALDHIRRNKPYDHSLDLTEAEHLHATEGMALSRMTTDELMALIQPCRRATARCSTCSPSRAGHTRTSPNISGISENTSKSQFMKARAYLRKLLPKETADIHGIGNE